MNSRRLLNVPFQIYRAPLSLLDTQVIQRLPEDLPARLLLDRALGSLDQAAGRFLDDNKLVTRGRDRLERSRKLSDAIRLEQQAAARRQTASDIAASGERRAAETEKQAETRLINGLKRADEVERDGKRAAASDARATADAKKEQAAEVAARRLDAINDDRSRAEDIANARNNSAQKKAAIELEDAARERADSAKKRSDADQLAQLTEEKRRSRVTP